MSAATLRFIGYRLLQAIPVMFGVTFITFCAVNLLPGSTAESLLGFGATTEEINALTVRLHLNQPFFDRYWHWLTGAVQGHLGISLAANEPISTILGQRLPVTLELVILAMVLSVGFAVPVAILSARKRRGIADRISMAISMVGISTPNFAIALLLILIFAVHWHVFPAIGFSPIGDGLGTNLRTVILPASSMAFGIFCHYTRILRADLIDQLQSEEYVVTAKAKGISPRQVLFGHVLRNSIFSLLTMIGLNLGVLVGGTVIVEQIFALPGIGQELIQSIAVKDVPVVQAIVVILSLAVVSVGLLTDLLYAVFDPRIRDGSRNS